MASVTQVAFQLDNDSLRQVDALAAAASSSRAEVLRAAVRELLRARLEAAIDEQLAAGYAMTPPGTDGEAWAELSVEGLRAAELDW
jgi:predicted transcriptional regulator